MIVTSIAFLLSTRNYRREQRETRGDPAGDGGRSISHFRGRGRELSDVRSTPADAAPARPPAALLRRRPPAVADRRAALVGLVTLRVADLKDRARVGRLGRDDLVVVVER